MSMINGMYVAFSILMAFAVLMAWWSVRQKLQEDNEKEQLKSKNTTAGENGDQS